MVFKRYETRFKAGEILTELIKTKDKELYNLILKISEDFFCYSIPNGGVPVAEGFCSMLNIRYDVLIVRKIKIPWNTEAGFGSVTTDGTILINESLLNQLNLSENEVNKSIKLTMKEIETRLEFYDKKIDEKINVKNIQNKYTFLIDDGLASGFTMLAAIKMIKKYNPKKIFVAVPTAPLHTVKRLQDEGVEIFCPNIRDVWRFAVADAYKSWYDVPESEVLEILNNSNFYVK